MGKQLIIWFLLSASLFGQASKMRSVTSLPASCNPGGGVGGSQMDLISLWNGSVATPEYCKSTNTFATFGSGSIGGLTQGRPLGVNNSLALVPSLLFWDCSLFVGNFGPNFDDTLNGCASLGITAGGGSIWTQALTIGTLTQQFNAGSEGPAPTLTLQSGGSLASGTFRISYTLSSTGCNGECTSSEEATVTTSGTCPGSGNCQFQVSAPPYPGEFGLFNPNNVTAWNLYCTTGAAWTETEGATGLTIGSPTTISSTCGGGAAISKANAALEVALPVAPSGTAAAGPGGWGCSITDGIHNCMKWFEHSNVHGAGEGEGGRWEIFNLNSSTNVANMCGSDTNGKHGNSYWSVGGFTCHGALNGTATVGTAVIDLESFPDTSEGYKLDAVAGANQTGIRIFGNGGGAGSHFNLIHSECSSASGCLPMSIGLNGSPSPAIAVTNWSAVHHGSGLPNVRIIGGSGGLILQNGYGEGNTSDVGTTACGTVSCDIDVGVSGGAGPVMILSYNVQVDAVGAAQWAINVRNQALTSVWISGLQLNRHSLNLVNDQISGKQWVCPSSPCDVAGPIVVAKGSGSSLPVYFAPGVAPPIATLANLPTCAAINEGLHAIATNCNAACTVGGTCTAGGATHCELYCNSSATYVETGN